MARAHVLDRAGTGNDFNAVAHYAITAIPGTLYANGTAAGANNAVGVSWKTCHLASFGAQTPTSSLPSTGNNNPAPGKISNAELTQIQAGDLVELYFMFSDDPSTDQTARLATLDMLATRHIDEHRRAFVHRFQYYGLERT